MSMHFKYEKLFGVYTKHLEREKKIPAFDIIPTAECVEMMDRYKMTHVRTDHGIQINYKKNMLREGRDVILSPVSSKDKLTFQFCLYAQDSGLRNEFNGSFNFDTAPHFYLTNKVKDNTESEEIKITKGVALGKKDNVFFQLSEARKAMRISKGNFQKTVSFENSFKKDKPLGFVEIYIKGGVFKFKDHDDDPATKKILLRPSFSYVIPLRKRSTQL